MPGMPEICTRSLEIDRISIGFASVLRQNDVNAAA
jgi:hypothetical protein